MEGVNKKARLANHAWRAEKLTYNGAKRCKGSKVLATVDTLVHLLALHITPANE